MIEGAAAGERDVWLWCNELPGFGVRVQKSGRKTYICRYRTHSRTQRTLTLARYVDMPPEQARALARKVFGQVAEGKDPAHLRRQAKDAPTIEDLRERYMREHAAPFKKPSSVKSDAQLWRLHILSVFGGRQVESVTRTEIIRLQGALADRPATANHAVALLSKAFNLAELWGWRSAGTNPCRMVKKYRMREREVILTPEQIKALDQALRLKVATKQVPWAFDALVRLLLVTGCRLNEIMSSERGWVDRERRLLLLPDSKVGQRRIPLSAAALAIIDGLPEGKWLIPGRLAGQHMQHPWHMWRRLAAQAGLPAGIRLHDLRHTVGSIGHRAGLSQKAIAGLLGHRQLSTTERYLHGYAGDAQRSVDAIADIVTVSWARP